MDMEAIYSLFRPFLGSKSRRLPNYEAWYEPIIGAGRPLPPILSCTNQCAERELRKFQPGYADGSQGWDSERREINIFDAHYRKPLRNSNAALARFRQQSNGSHVVRAQHRSGGVEIAINFLSAIRPHSVVRFPATTNSDGVSNPISCVESSKASFCRTAELVWLGPVTNPIRE